LGARLGTRLGTRLGAGEIGGRGQPLGR
jgi:hypothetical protein